MPSKTVRARQGADAERAEILCVGEVLWDALPAGLFLGGAPFNVAYHLHRQGAEVHVASAVGRDPLIAELLGADVAQPRDHSSDGPFGPCTHP